MFAAREFVEVTFKPSGLRLAGTIRHTDGQNLLVKLNADNVADIQPGAQIALAQASRDGLYIVNTVIRQYRDACFQAPLAPPTFVERRKRLRKATELKARFNPREVPYNVPEAFVSNLSMGGAKLCVYAACELKTMVDLTLRLNETESLDVICQVMRCAYRESGLTGCWEGMILELSSEVAVKFVQVSRIGQVQLQRFLQAANPQAPACQKE